MSRPEVDEDVTEEISQYDFVGYFREEDPNLPEGRVSRGLQPEEAKPLIHDNQAEVGKVILARKKKIFEMQKNDLRKYKNVDFTVSHFALS